MRNVHGNIAHSQSNSGRCEINDDRLTMTMTTSALVLLMLCKMLMLAGIRSWTCNLHGRSYNMDCLHSATTLPRHIVCHILHPLGQIPDVRPIKESTRYGLTVSNPSNEILPRLLDDGKFLWIPIFQMIRSTVFAQSVRYGGQCSGITAATIQG